MRACHVSSNESADMIMTERVTTRGPSVRDMVVLQIVHGRIGQQGKHQHRMTEGCAETPKDEVVTSLQDALKELSTHLGVVLH